MCSSSNMQTRYLCSKNASLITSRPRIPRRIATFEARGPTIRCCGLPRNAPGTASLTTAPAREERPHQSRSQKTHLNRCPSKGRDGDDKVRVTPTVRDGSTPTTKPYFRSPRRTKGSSKHTDSNYKSISHPRSSAEETVALRRYLTSGSRSILVRDRYVETMDELAGAIARLEEEDDDRKMETRMSGWRIARLKAERQQDRAKGQNKVRHPSSAEQKTGIVQNTDSKFQGLESQEEPKGMESEAHSPISKKEFTKYLLRIYRPLESARLARVRRNDLRNLSFIEAEAKLGLASELYTGLVFAAQGGRGARTKRWRDRVVVARFERETGEEAFWVRKGDESRRAKAGEGKTKAKLEVTKHSFSEIWEDLASVVRRKYDLNSTDVPAKTDKPADLPRLLRNKKA